MTHTRLWIAGCLLIAACGAVHIASKPSAAKDETVLQDAARHEDSYEQRFQAKQARWAREAMAGCAEEAK